MTIDFNLIDDPMDQFGNQSIPQGNQNFGNTDFAGHDKHHIQNESGMSMHSHPLNQNPMEDGRNNRFNESALDGGVQAHSQQNSNMYGQNDNKVVDHSQQRFSGRPMDDPTQASTMRNSLSGQGHDNGYQQMSHMNNFNQAPQQQMPPASNGLSSVEDTGYPPVQQNISQLSPVQQQPGQTYLQQQSAYPYSTPDQTKPFGQSVYQPPPSVQDQNYGNNVQSGYRPQQNIKANPTVMSSNQISQNRPRIPIQIAKEFFELVKQGNLELIQQEVLNKSIDVTSLYDDNFKHTVLYYAAQIRDKENAYNVVKYFIEKGVQAGYTDTLNQTVLFYVSRDNQLKCLDLLLAKGCNTNHRDTYGQTPLYYASRDGHYEMVKRLLENGAKASNIDTNGLTAMFYSAREGRLEITKLLLEAGCDINQADKKKCTALFWAKKNNHLQVAQYLENNGGVPNVDPRKTAQVQKQKSIPVKKKPINEKKFPKKFQLTKVVDGFRVPLSDEELRQILDENPQIAKLLRDPQAVQQLHIPNVPESAPISECWEKAATRIMQNLGKQQGAYIFAEKVDTVALNIPDYYDIVKNPMDFGLIKQKLKNNVYSKCQEFIDDVQLVFDNCILYNGDATQVGIIAKNISEEFKKQYANYQLDFYLV